MGRLPNVVITHLGYFQRLSTRSMLQRLRRRCFTIGRKHAVRPQGFTHLCGHPRPRCHHKHEQGVYIQTDIPLNTRTSTVNRFDRACNIKRVLCLPELCANALTSHTILRYGHDGTGSPPGIQYIVRAVHISASIVAV